MCLILVSNVQLSFVVVGVVVVVLGGFFAHYINSMVLLLGPFNVMPGNNRITCRL